MPTQTLTASKIYSYFTTLTKEDREQMVDRILRKLANFLIDRILNDMARGTLPIDNKAKKL